MTRPPRTFTHDLATGIAGLDRQHAELFDRAARVFGALEEGLPDTELMLRITSLEQSALVHFAAEERLMRAHALPEFERHLGERASFREALGRLKEEFFRQGPCEAVGARLQEFVDGWLVGHIASADARLALFLGASAPHPVPPPLPPPADRDRRAADRGRGSFFLP